MVLDMHSCEDYDEKNPGGERKIRTTDKKRRE
jgi:hypothetical protein